MSDPSLLSLLARSFLAGEPTVEQIVPRAATMLGRRWRWLKPLAGRYIQAFSGQIRPRHKDVVRFLREDPGFRDARSKYLHKISVRQWLVEPTKMQPAVAAATWDLPVIESVGALASWFELTPGELEWFADLKGLEYKVNNPRLRHYHYRVLRKMSGDIRLIEAPKLRLKDLQKQVLARILDQIPPHPAVHGFRKGRSIKTFIEPHVRQRVVLRMDLKDFFPSFTGARIQSFFRTIGYPESVADLLGGVCTNAAPKDVWKEAGFDVDRARLSRARALYCQPHLPQGAPTSPALANLCAYRMDCRLAGLAKAVGAEYTRYADDLAFSGGEEFERCVERFSIQAAAILLEEGYSAHHRKTRIMRQGVRQHLAGLVANQSVNVRRTDFDRLKAILTNCLRLGPDGQNRKAHPQFRSHLEGRVGFVEMINPAKGKRLRAILEQIRWERTKDDEPSGQT
jgi:RNA-directed DNA polymerase